MERSVMFWYIYTLCNNRGNYTHHLEHLLHCGGTFKILFCNCFQADNALLLAIVTLCAVESDVGGDVQPVSAHKKRMEKSRTLVTQGNLHSTDSAAA